MFHRYRTREQGDELEYRPTSVLCHPCGLKRPLQKDGTMSDGTVRGGIHLFFLCFTLLLLSTVPGVFSLYLFFVARTSFFLG